MISEVMIMILVVMVISTVLYVFVEMPIDTCRTMFPDSKNNTQFPEVYEGFKK